MGLTDDDVREILRIIDESDLDELSIETPELSLRVSRRGTGGAAGPSPVGTSPVTVSQDEASRGGPGVTGEGVVAPASPAIGEVIEAPMLGTVYHAESPSHSPFVAVGDWVAPDTVVCLIEVMKLMNHIQAGVSGRIVEVLAPDGSLVEYGQPLFAVAPA